MIKKNMKNLLLFYATALGMTVYLVWRAFFTIPTTFGYAALAFGVMMIISEISSVLEALHQYWHMTKTFIPELPELPDEKFPHVDVFIATHNEPVDLLYKTANACTYLDYPDKSKIHVYICDDTNRPEMAKLAQELNVGYFGLAYNTLAKAGNLNNALAKSDSPLIVTFDADMIPQRNFLLRTVPYFFLPQMKKDEDGSWVFREEHEIDPDEKIGFIQTPQSFYNPDLFQYNLYAETRVPNEQDYFFREINVGRNSTNAPIYAGSNTVISREALELVGGIATGTITEDFETGLNIQKKGYTTYAVPEVLAQGLSPTTVKSLLSQRERWARGCVQSLKHSKLFRDRDLSLSTKVSYTACLVYWWAFFRRFVYIASPILFAAFNLRVVDCSHWEILIFWLPAYLLYNQMLKKLSGTIRNQHWSNVIDTVMFPYLIIPVFFESIGLKQQKFVVTKKSRGAEDRESTLLYALPHIFLLVLSLWALWICIVWTLESAALYNIIIIYWLCINAKNLILAIFFMLGRKNQRQAERFPAQLPVEISYLGRKLHGMTVDISETGLSVLLERPEYLPHDEMFDLEISGDGYSAALKSRIVHVEQQGEKWCYSMEVEPADEHSRREFYQIVYDRGHPLPSVLSPSLSVYDDLNLNLNLRKNALYYQARRLPRVQLEVTISLPYGNSTAYRKSAVIENFNYRYILLRGFDDFEPDGLYSLSVGSELWLRLREVEAVYSPGDGSRLFAVENWQELAASPQFAHVLDSWMTATRGDSPTVIQGEPVLV